MGEENGVESLCNVAICTVLITLFIGPYLTVIFSELFQGKRLGMLVFLLCLTGVVHYLVRTNDHYMPEKELADLPFSSVFQIDDPFPPWYPPSDPPSYWPWSPESEPPPSSPAASYPSSSSMASYPSSSPASTYPPLSPTASYPSSSSFSSFYSPPLPPFKVRPPTFIIRGNLARMVSDFSLSLSEDSGDSDIDTKAWNFIKNIKSNRKIERRKTRMAKKV